MARRQGTETVTIHAGWWNASETVDILANMTHGIKRQIEASMASFIDTSGIDPNKPDMADVKVNLKDAIAVGDDLKLILFVKSWTLADAQGVVLPLTQASMDSLAEEDIAFIGDEIDKRNVSANVTPEQRAAFLQKQGSGTPTDTVSVSPLPGG